MTYWGWLGGASGDQENVTAWLFRRTERKTQKSRSAVLIILPPCGVQLLAHCAIISRNFKNVNNFRGGLSTFLQEPDSF